MSASDFGMFLPVNSLSCNKKMSKQEEYAIRLGLSLQQKFPGVAFLVQPVLKKKITEDVFDGETIQLSLTIVKSLSIDKESDLAQHCSNENTIDFHILVDTYTIQGENWRALIEMQEDEITKKQVRCFASHRALYKAATEIVCDAELKKFWSLGIVRSYVEQRADLKKILNEKGVSTEQICEHFSEAPNSYTDNFDGSAILAQCADQIKN